MPLHIERESPGEGRKRSASEEPVSEHAFSEPLLQTKFFAPRPGPIVPRPRLTTLLDDSHRRPLTLVSAPPGYGKTTLIVEAQSNSSDDWVWLLLDARDNDPVRFFSYLLAALQQWNGQLGRGARELLSLPHLPSAEILATSLLNDLSLSLPGDPTPGSCLVLVLDDYHLIAEPIIHQAIEFIVLHAPPRFHLVLGTRQDPPFALARLRVGGQLIEIRADDLRFTKEEATDWLIGQMGLNLEAAEIDRLESRTEGWIAGIRLAGLSLQGRDRDHISEFIAAFGGSERYVIDYLLEQVLTRQPEDRVRFLRETAVLDRLTSGLCDAVTGRSDSKAMLAQLEQDNLFLIPLDGRREWYRYHPLFADFLRAELDDGERRRIECAAARWYEANRHPMEAIEHALAGQDWGEASRLINQVASGLFERGELGTLRRWFAALPECARRERPSLATYRAWSLYFGARFPEAAACADAIAWPEDADPVDRGRWFALQASLRGQRDDWASSAELARQALTLLGDHAPFFHIAVTEVLAAVEREAGHDEEVTRLMREAYELADRFNYPFARVIAVTTLIPNLHRQGRRGEALALCRRMMEQDACAPRANLASAGALDVQLGILEYAANDVEAAFEHVTRGLATYRELGIERVAMGDGEWTLIQILCARGELDAALELARKTQEQAAQVNYERIAAIMEAIAAYVQLKRGNLEAAGRWAEQAGANLPLPPLTNYEIMYFIRARVLLAQSRFQEALGLLELLEASARQSGRNARLITVHILQALAERGLARPDAGVDRLAAAIRLAAPEQYRRAFLDEGPGVAALLPRARPQAPQFVDDLLAAFGQAEPSADFGEHPPASAGRASFPPSPPVPTPSVLTEPLSDREREVLQLLAEGKSNAEIARALVVTVGTAKWHVHHVLEKLGVSNRTQAVVRARKAGLV